MSVAPSNTAQATASDTDEPPIPTPMASAFPTIQSALQLRTVQLASDFLYTNQVYDVDAFGPKLVFSELDGTSAGRGQQVWLVDLEANTYEALNPIERGVIVLAPRISGNDVVWSSDSDGPHGSVDWNIEHYDLASGTTNVVDSGTNVRTEDGSALAPGVDVDGGLIAYPVESPTKEQPLGWSIVVRRLSDGQIVRQVQTTYALWDFRLDHGNLLYVEGPVTDTEPTVGAGVKFLASDQTDPVLVAASASKVSLDGNRLTWAGSAGQVLNQPVVDEQVLTATVDNLSPTVLSRPTEGMPGGRFPSAGDDVVAWNDSEYYANNLAVWNSSTDRTVTIARDSYFYLIAIGGGWVTWAIESDATDPAQQLFQGLPANELTQAMAVQ